MRTFGLRIRTLGWRLGALGLGLPALSACALDLGLRPRAQGAGCKAKKHEQHFAYYGDNKERHYDGSHHHNEHYLRHHFGAAHYSHVRADDNYGTTTKCHHAIY